MHINELPHVILAGIFHWACSNPSYSSSTNINIETWGTKLAPLAVCRTWRELALPRVHRVSFIQCNPIDKPESRDNSATHHVSDSDAHGHYGVLDYIKDETYVVKSNLDIIGNTGSKIWPRTVQIFVKTSNDPVYGLQVVIEKLRNHTTLLKKATGVELYYNKIYATIPRTNETDNIAEANSIGEDIYQLIPHVQYFKVGEYINSDTFVTFAQSLVKCCAHQLTGFECRQYALEKVQSFSDNLRHAHIRGNENTLYMPRICAENLTKLTLDYVKSDFDWSSFEGNSRSRSLHFANLKRLRLEVDFEHNYIDVVNDEIRCFAREFNYKVIAPKLETVTLRLCPFTLSFLSSIHGLTTIPNVELFMIYARVYFTGFNLDVARDKFASYAKNSQDDFQTIDICGYMNDMFNLRGLAKSSKAKISFSNNLLNFRRMDWKYLLNIEIHCSFYANDLRTLVSKAPSLETIYIRRIKIKEDGKLLSEIQDEAATVKPISPSLKFISFGDLIDCTESERDRFMVYLSKLTLKD